jgi:hypothetical protein
VNTPRIPASFRGLLVLYFVQFLEHLHRYGEVVFLEFENGLGVVQEDIRVEHEGLGLCRNPHPRLKGCRPTRDFHRCGYDVNNYAASRPFVHDGFVEFDGEWVNNMTPNRFDRTLDRIIL